ncbi:hypothetical protein BO94DRAFT_585784 [Aspergillus sclerotioniger CBS 115572]|uniref:Xylanolytic transcriptional activator regulatory domain-containing protein n=1 Tax=Aspergillus sclerotioniger CBS 115572 TaxID=1450535 RepID=A0A317WN94_9EURO|nr:hypothetical protein BO94DRAFT_585784 [Aspergillus sclerotioniger CBS 115572]PWY87231.1 hypothetical protein BO94DRAFT_585784 [Aspergillus sclerotioniger CBS 115572]
MDQIEGRYARLTTLVQRLNPDIDIEDVLALPSDAFRDKERDAFEWSLDSSAGLDGMASLPASTEVGYPDKAETAPKKQPDSSPGNSANSTILRTVPGLLFENPGSISSREASPSPTQDFWCSGHLTNTTILDGLLDAYFTCYNPSYPVVHERTFRQKYQDRHQIPPHSNWHAIFYVVLAIGNWILGHSSASKQCVYYHAARSRMSLQMLESGSLSTVQVFLLMGNYLLKQDRPNTGSNLIGIAYRMALGLGLYRELPPGKSELLFHERRRALWWIVYCFDSAFSLTIGRSVMGSNFIETRLPRNIDDSTCILSSNLPPPTDHPTGYSAIIAQAQLASIGNSIYTTVISAPQGAVFDIKTTRSLDHQLEAWCLSLPLYFTAHDIPEWFRGPRAIVFWKEQNLRMMLWWGARRLTCSLPAEIEDARDMCNYVAIETIQDITTFCLEYPECLHPGLGWYATYFLFQASVVLSFYSIHSNNLPNGLGMVDRELWMISLSRARECLTSLSRSVASAKRYLRVLDQIRELAPGVDIPELSSERMDTHPPFDADPALQILFQDEWWNGNILEGLTESDEAFSMSPPANY